MNFFKTYEVIRTSPDELVVIAHIGYIFILVALVLFGLAARYYYIGLHSPSGKSLATIPLIFLALNFCVMSIPHGKMVFNKKDGTFKASRTSFYLMTVHTEAALGDVVAAKLNQANTTYQLYVQLRNSDKAVTIYGLDSAVGQDDAARAIDRFLEEYTPPQGTSNGDRDSDTGR